MDHGAYVAASGDPNTADQFPLRISLQSSFARRAR
jgi:hypothetical protein